MASDPQRRPRTIRNLSLFVAAILALPWLGYALDAQTGTTGQQESLGWLLFLITPLAASLLLRLFGGDGWRDLGLNPRLRQHWRWYVFALLFHPVGHLAILLLGVGLGALTLPDSSPASLALIGQAMAATVAADFFKNIFEEFAWRGYLAPKLNEVLGPRLLAHAVVGVVWFAWHLPYYLVLLPPATLASFTALPSGVFLLLTFIALVLAAVVYGEVRLATQSVWPAVLMHTAGNTLIGALIMRRFFLVPAELEWLLSPGWSSLASFVFFAGTGLWLYRRRTLAERAAPDQAIR